MNNTTKATKKSAKVTAIRAIVKLYFVGAIVGSFIHIVTAAMKLGGHGIEAYSVPFMIDGIAIIGMVMRSQDFSKRTNRIGFKVQCGMGLLSLIMNVLAAHNLFGVLYGVAIVALFVFSEWLSDQIDPASVDNREAELAAVAAAELAVREAEAAMLAKKAATSAKRAATIARNKRAKARQMAAPAGTPAKILVPASGAQINAANASLTV